MDKQKEILAAALKLFVEFGFHGTPTSKIAKEAGVANGTLFHYFKTKDELIVALYIDIKTRLAACITSEMLASDSIKEKCRKFYINALYWAFENTVEFKFVQQFISSPYLMLIAPEEIQKQSRASVELLQEGIDTKIIKPLPVEYVSILINNHLFGVYQYLSMANLPKTEQEKLMHDSFEMVWEMLT